MWWIGVTIASTTFYIIYKRIKLKLLIRDWQVYEDYQDYSGHGNYALEMLKTPTGWIDGTIELAQKMPNSGVMWIHPFLPRLFLNDPVSIKSVLSANPETFLNDGKFPGGLGVGHGLLGLNGSRWRYHRKFLTPSMHLKILMDYIPVIGECARIFVDVLQERQVSAGKGNYFCMKHELNNYTIDVMLRCLMSFESDIQANPRSLNLIAQTEILAQSAHYKAYTPIPQFLWYVHPLYKKQQKALKDIHTILDSVITNREEEMADPDFLKKQKYLNFIDLILSTNRANKLSTAADDSVIFTRDEIREELLTVLLAGQETTFSALTWFFSCYAKNAEWASKARAEVHEILQGRQDVTWEDINKLDVVARMLKESQRMHPTIVQLNPRVLLKQDLKIPDGRIIRAGTDVCINVAGLHMNPEIYDEPEKYNPDRWLLNTKNSAFSFIPFSGGARSCLGKQFALIEMKAVIMVVINRLNIEEDPENPPRIKHSCTTALQGDFRVRVEEVDF